MSPKGKIEIISQINKEVKEDHKSDQSEGENRVQEEPSEEIEAKEPELVDSGNDSDGIISSEEDDEEGVALKDSDEEGEGGGTLSIPAAIAALPAAAFDDDVPERPPPNKKHKCLQVINHFLL